MPGTVQELASMFRRAIDSQGNVSLSGDPREQRSRRGACEINCFA